MYHSQGRATGAARYLALRYSLVEKSQQVSHEQHFANRDFKRSVWVVVAPVEAWQGWRSRKGGFMIKGWQIPIGDGTRSPDSLYESPPKKPAVHTSFCNQE